MTQDAVSSIASPHHFQNPGFYCTPLMITLNISLIYVGAVIHFLDKLIYHLNFKISINKKFLNTSILQCTVSDYDHCIPIRWYLSIFIAPLPFPYIVTEVSRQQVCRQN